MFFMVQQQKWQKKMSDIKSIKEEIALNIIRKADKIYEEKGEQAALEYIDSLNEDETQIIKEAGLLSKSIGPLSGAYDYFDRRSQGQSFPRALGGAITTGIGGSIGNLLGSLGGFTGSLIGGAGGALGSSFAYDTLMDKYFGKVNNPTTTSSAVAATNTNNPIKRNIDKSALNKRGPTFASDYLLNKAGNRKPNLLNPNVDTAPTTPKKINVAPNAGDDGTKTTTSTNAPDFSKAGQTGKTTVPPVDAPVIKKSETTTTTTKEPISVSKPTTTARPKSLPAMGTGLRDSDRYGGSGMSTHGYFAAPWESGSKESVLGIPVAARREKPSAPPIGVPPVASPIPDNSQNPATQTPQSINRRMTPSPDSIYPKQSPGGPGANKPFSVPHSLYENEKKNNFEQFIKEEFLKRKK